nr:hypothetical protein [Kibdelosporangium sp. MJ126-NF4]CTQ96959.1 hypothetical protein [Kibdelosporangium sp. MJ126-NF4]
MVRPTRRCHWSSSQGAHRRRAIFNWKTFYHNPVASAWLGWRASASWKSLAAGIVGVVPWSFATENSRVGPLNSEVQTLAGDSCGG